MDPISDMLNRIVTAQNVSRKTVRIPFSKTKFQIAGILEKEGFIESAEKKGRGSKKSIRISLRYKEDGEPVISGFKMISKPSKRVYIKSKDIKKVKGGFGISVISTSRGLMTGKVAKKNKLGGEIIFNIW